MLKQFKAALILGVFCMFCRIASASSVYNVTLNTAPLVGHPPGPFYLFLEFTDGSGIGDANNTVTVNNINFGGGSSLGTAFLSGGATGSLESGITITDSSFVSVFGQQFAPGLQLSFSLRLTSNNDAGEIPDGFAFFILDSSGAPLPTLAPAGDYFLAADLRSTGLTFHVYGSDPSRAPSVGNPVSIGAPAVRGRSQTTIASLTSTTAAINVFGFGFTPPSGQLSFTDMTAGNQVAAPVTLNASTATTSLLPQATASTGDDSLPDWTTLADVNDDGNLDLVTSLFHTDSMSVQLGNGDGTFKEAKQILVVKGFGPAENQLASLRGNGILDVIVASSNTNEIAVLLGNGDGTFQHPVFYAVGSASNRPTSLTTGDFDLDGNLDVAVVDPQDDTVSILAGNGNGQLTQSGSPISVGRYPKVIRAGDFNGDGYSDLAVANYVDGTVTTLLNNQDGTFTSKALNVGSGAGSGPRALAINSSGSALLLAVANYKDNTVSVLRSKGDGTFGPETSVPVGKGPDDLSFADFNGDGILDLVVANYADDTVNLIVGTPTGIYSVRGPFSVGNGPCTAAVGDLNQDGTPDLVVSNFFSNNNGVLLSGTQVSVPYTGLSLLPGDSVQASYLPDGSSRYESSTSSRVTVPKPTNAKADLYLRVEPSPTPIAQGDLLTYAFPIWNLGPGDAVHEVLTTQVPEGTTFDYIRISGTPDLGTCTTPPYQGTGQIVCHENSSMAPNTTWTVRLTVKVTAPAGTVITENAATMADTFDPNLANNTATVSTTVQ